MSNEGRKLPRGVYTVDCPKMISTVQTVSEVEYKIYKGSDKTPLSIVKGCITYDHILKAAKCAKINPFVVSIIGSPNILRDKNSFPIKCDVSIIPPPVEYVIYQKGSATPIMSVPGQITNADVEKAASIRGMRCWGVSKVIGRFGIPITTTPLLKKSDFPVKYSVIIEEFVQYRIFSSNGYVISTVIGKITYKDIQEAANQMKIKKLSASKAVRNKCGVIVPTTTILRDEFPVMCDVIIKETKVVKPLVKEYKIFKAKDFKLLQIVKGAITKEHLDKAAICAGFGSQYSVYKNPICSPITVKDSDSLKCDLYLRKKLSKLPHNVHSVRDCETTSVAPVRKLPRNVHSVRDCETTSVAPVRNSRVSSVNNPSTQSSVASPKKKLVREAVKGLTAAIKALNELEKSI